MLTRMLAVFAALAVIGFAAVVAPSPAVAQTGGDSTATTTATATATATATPTATPAPGPESFALTSSVGKFSPRGLTRLGNKWYVAGFQTIHLHIFSDAGTYERRINTAGRLMPGSSIRGLTAIGTDLLAISGDVPRLVRWTPQANANTEATPTWTQALPAPQGGGRYTGQGVAYDGTHAWVAASHAGKHVLLKYNPSLSAALVATYRMNQAAGALVHENGYLYAISNGNRDLLRISPTSLSTTSANNWDIVRRSVEIRNGLVFRNGTAYGFNAAQDEVRKARQPSAERLFSLTPSVGKFNPRGLTRLGNKWYVAGHETINLYIFSDTGTYERSISTAGRRMPGASIRGLTAIGTDLLVISGDVPRLHRWTPQATGEATPSWVQALPAPPGGGRYLGQGVAYDGTHAWVAASWPNDGSAAHATKHALLKYNPTTSSGGLVATYRMNQEVNSLVHENGYLYAISNGNRDLMRISPTSLSTTSANNWEVVRRSVEIRHGLAFRNGVAYGFNQFQDEVRKARQPSTERLFALTPSIGNLNPQSLARLGNKWYVGGHSGDGYIHIFNNDGTTPPSPSPSRIKKPAAEIRGLTSDGTNLIAAAVSRAEAIAFADGSRVDVRVPHVYKWTPQTDATTSVSATPFCIPNALGYTPNGVAHDGTHIWVALDSPARNILVKLHGTTGAHVGTYRMNSPVAGLTHQNGNLYGLSGGNIVIAIASHLKTSPATWVNNWEVVKRDSGLADGLAFRNGTAYGFNAAQDEARAERGNPTITTALPTTPTTTTPTTPTSPTTTTPTTPTPPTTPASPAS